MLSLVKYGHHRGSMIQSDDSYLTFNEETQATVFYQVVRSHKQIVMNGLSAKMNQVLGKLYATDLIGSLTKMVYFWSISQKVGVVCLTYLQINIWINLFRTTQR